MPFQLQHVANSFLLPLFVHRIGKLGVGICRFNYSVCQIVSGLYIGMIAGRSREPSYGVSFMARVK
jgi:hypothetical protein